MKLEFRWTSTHPTIQPRILLASGDAVKVLDETGTEIGLPSAIRSKERLHIAPRFVAYGAEQNWMLRVLVDDVTGHTLKNFEVEAIYDDTVEPTKTEEFVKSQDVAPNKMSDHDKTLTIPRLPRGYW